MNIAIGTTKFPDFSLVTHDNYLDILEIKKPSTEILKHDASRGNYFFDTEISKAVVQVENYIANVTTFAADVRSYILDNHKIDLKVVRPRGIILAGDARTFSEQKQKDDFRLLSQGVKNLSIVTYDELLTRLKNYIEVLEEFTHAPQAVEGVTSGHGSPKKKH
jgi:Shedu protein SduA, C-terminal